MSDSPRIERAHKDLTQSSLSFDSGFTPVLQSQGPRGGRGGKGRTTLFVSASARPTKLGVGDRVGVGDRGMEDKRFF